MRLMVKGILMTAMALAVLTLAAACGDDDGDVTPTPEATATPEASPTLLPFDNTPTPTPPPAITEVGIELAEFSIRPEKTRARPGTVIFKVRNAGQLTHQFLVIRTDLPTAGLPRRPGEGGVDESQLDVVGRIDSIEPGEEAEVSVPVETGSYVLICNLVSGGESHYLNGMYTRFEVTPSAPDPGTPPATEEPSPTP